MDKPYKRAWPSPTQPTPEMPKVGYLLCFDCRYIVVRSPVVKLYLFSILEM